MSESSVTITPPVPSDIVSAMGPLEKKIAKLEITNEATHAQGLEFGKRLKGMKSLILDMFLEPKKKAFELHKAMTSSEKRYLQPIEAVQLTLNRKLNTYEAAERARAEAEARARQEEAQRAEEERTIAEAVTADEAGDPELAQAILDAPVVAPTVLPTPKVAEVAGASTRTIWSAEVVNLLALVRYVAEHPEHVGLLQANQTALNGMARAMKENMRFPGVRAVSEVSRSFKAD